MPLTSVAWLLLLAVPVAASAGSARIELRLQPGLTAESEYWPGEVDKPAVLVLHGFLATREFPTVRRLAQSLADEGFSVLAPTLSLGLNRRRQSVACEAIHTHTMTQDVEELRAWTRWLKQHTGKVPVLVGHSAGGVHLAALLDSLPPVEIERAILVSLSYFGEEQSGYALSVLRARAEEDLRERPRAVMPYALSYCSTYVSTPGAVLSYLAWDKDRLRTALARSGVPVTVVYGDRDERIDRGWLNVLRDAGIEVRSVAGAGHFFSLAHDFDLLDEVLDTMTGVVNG